MPIWKGDRDLKNKRIYKENKLINNLIYNLSKEEFFIYIWYVIHYKNIIYYKNAAIAETSAQTSWCSDSHSDELFGFIANRNESLKETRDYQVERLFGICQIDLIWWSEHTCAEDWLRKLWVAIVDSHKKKYYNFFVLQGETGRSFNRRRNYNFDPACSQNAERMIQIRLNYFIINKNGVSWYLKISENLLIYLTYYYIGF